MSMNCIADSLVLRIDGAQPLSTTLIKTIETVCDEAECHGGPGIVAVYVSGTPGAAGTSGDGTWTRDLNVTLVSKWERAVRRLECSPLPTVCVASGDCGGIALDALLATDVRIADPALRLLVCTDGEATWPGMAAFRLVRQAGMACIRQAVLFGMPIAASEALAIRLIDELSDDTAGALAVTAGLIGACSGSELAIRRQLMFDGSWMSFEDALGPHLAACDRAIRRNHGREMP